MIAESPDAGTGGSARDSDLRGVAKPKGATPSADNREPASQENSEAAAEIALPDDGLKQ